MWSPAPRFAETRKTKTKAALALLKLGADPRATDNRKRNRWHYLHVHLWEELAQKLLELRVNSNQRDIEGRTPLLLCCQELLLDLEQ